MAYHYVMFEKIVVQKFKGIVPHRPDVCSLLVVGVCVMTGKRSENLAWATRLAFEATEIVKNMPIKSRTCDKVFLALLYQAQMQQGALRIKLRGWLN